MPGYVTEYPDLFPQIPKLQFHEGDMFETDWSEAGLIFINSTCFSPEFMIRIADVTVKPGTLAITTTRHFNSESWEVLESRVMIMSWGDATVHLSRRKIN